MNFVPAYKPEKIESLGVLAHLIVVNKQIHCFQINALEEYLGAMSFEIPSVLSDILDGKDDAMSFDSCLSAYRMEKESVQAEIFYMLNVLSYIDNAYEVEERGLINKILEASVFDFSIIEEYEEKAKLDAELVRQNNNTIFIRYNSIDKRNWFKKLIGRILNFFRKLFGFDVRLTEDSYRASIQRCSEIAREDFNSIIPTYREIVNSCSYAVSEIKKYRRDLVIDNQYSEDVAKAVDVFLEALKKKVYSQTVSAKESFEQKERSVGDFTISLLGRTKAGKSTLHAILTKQGKDKIGVGMQRTTRYNRVYQWNLLRLIDTPGIGSAEAAGRSDDEIAQSVLGESDVICFIIADDSIQRDILECLKRISQLNKPIIVVLNHKDNIEPDVKFRRFIKNPMKWLNTDGEDSLQGHVNRINRYAEDEGFRDLLRIYPVFLLPALLSSEPRFSDKREMLWESSNIDAFIDQLEQWIMKTGSIKRSQTILDETIQLYTQSDEQITKANMLLHEQINKTESQRVVMIQELKNTETVVQKKVSEVLEDSLDRLVKNEALAFAEKHYKDKKNLAKLWAEYVERIGFVDEVRDAINQEIGLYTNKATELVSDIFEDFYFSTKSVFDASRLNMPLQFDFKALALILGGTSSVVGAIILAVTTVSNPVGIILAAVGTILELGSALFSSKEQRRQQAIDKVYGAVRKSVESNAKDEISRTVESIKKNLNKSTEEINNIFVELKNGLQNVIQISEKLSADYDAQIRILNHLYAYRILEYLLKQDGKMFDKDIEEVISVERTDDRKMLITTTSVSIDNTECLRGTIAETVVIQRRLENE